MEGLFGVELVSVGSSHDVGVHVLLGHEQLTIADHRVLRETRTVVKPILLISGLAILVKGDVSLPSAPPDLRQGLGAVEGRAEVGSPAVGLVVRGGVHHGLLAVAATEGMKVLILSWDLHRVEPLSLFATFLTLWTKMLACGHQSWPSGTKCA